MTHPAPGDDGMTGWRWTRTGGNAWRVVSEQYIREMEAELRKIHLLARASKAGMTPLEYITHLAENGP